ncbi:MAG: hypothetical protein ACP5RX_00120 [Minisyncoccia bacterium]
MRKKLFKVQVLNFSDKIKEYFVWAYSEQQAGLIIAKRFNKEFHFDPKINYVNMEVEVLDQKRKKKEVKENEK